MLRASFLFIHRHSKPKHDTNIGPSVRRPRTLTLAILTFVSIVCEGDVQKLFDTIMHRIDRQFYTLLTFCLPFSRVFSGRDMLFDIVDFHPT